MPFNDRTNERVGALVLLGHAGWAPDGAVLWTCRCDCGQTKAVRGGALLANLTGTVSCGCIGRLKRFAPGHNYKHGYNTRNSPTYAVWAAMRQRCTNPNHPKWKGYGGRGIKVCARWRKFKNFLADMGFLPAGLSLDRIDNNKGYMPSNCRWATRTAQQNNTRHNRLISAGGKTMSVSAWARERGMKRASLDKRLRSGWSAERALGFA